MSAPLLQTPHLFLRGWTAADADVLFGILQEEGLLRYFPNPHPPSHARVDAYIAHHRAQWEERGYGHWAIVTREDGCVVGWNGLEFLAELSETEVAYLLTKRVWGRGYASEAAREAIRFGFETVGLNAIIGLVHPDNIASISVLEKCGLRFANRITLWGMAMSRYRIARGDYVIG
jgi:RimJ/RimL family protein N-acetyltransferase